MKEGMGTQSSRMEQIQMQRPQVTVYFSGDQYVDEKDIRVSLGEERAELQSLDRFVNTGEALHYYIMLDISASISHEEFGRIRSALQEFGNEIREEDQLTVITFGDDVNEVLTMTGKEIRAGSTFSDQIGALTNYDQNTAFYEALSQAASKISSAGSGKDGRSVLCVITDGEDMTTGKASRSEALTALQQNGTALYAFAPDETKTEYTNSLGEFSRATGGNLTVMEKGSEADGLSALHVHLLRSYKADCLADNNIISHNGTTVTLENDRTGITQNRTVLETGWIRDSTAPRIENIERCSDHQLWITFSEAVCGIESAENYSLTMKETETVSVPAYASPGGDQSSVLLTFPETLNGGEYLLKAENITDVSMERNSLLPADSFSLEKTAAQLEEEQVLQEENTAENTGNTAAAETERTQDLPGMVSGVILACSRMPVWQKGGILGGTVLGLIALLILRKKAVRRKKAIEEKRRGKKIIMTVNGTSEELQLTLKSTMIVGRARQCDLRFSDPSMSRQHFALGMEKGNVVISNLSESGFTAVNGDRIGAGEKVLRSGDVISAGSMRLKLAWT